MQTCSDEELKLTVTSLDWNLVDTEDEEIDPLSTSALFFDSLFEDEEDDDEIHRLLLGFELFAFLEVMVVLLEAC